MAALPTTRRFKPDDYKGAPAWFARFLALLNEYTEAIYRALSRNLTLSENFAASIREFSFATPATYSVGDFEALRWEHGLTLKVLGVLLLQVSEMADNQPVMQGPVSIDWLEQNGAIVIRRVQGLEDSKRYLVRVAAVV